MSQIQIGGIRATLNRAWKMAPYRESSAGIDLQLGTGEPSGLWD